MTHQLTPYHNHQAGSRALSGPAANTLQERLIRFIDLTPLQQAVDKLMAMFNAALAADDYPKMCRIWKVKRTGSRKLEQAKVHNFMVGIKWTMLRRPKWREAVLDDLGGEKALETWEVRAEKAAAKAPKPYKQPEYKRPPLASLRSGTLKLPPIRTAFDVKTDASGCFRLAPIPTNRAKRPDGFEPKPLTETQICERKEAWRLRTELRERQARHENFDESELKGYWYKDERTNTIYRMPPIPLWPDELRGDVMTEVIPVKAEPQNRDLVQTERGVPCHKLGTEITSKHLGHSSTRSRMCDATRLLRDDNGGVRKKNIPP